MRGKTSKEAWNILQQEFEGDSKVRTVKLQSLKRDYENEIMKENESLNEYFNRLSELVNQMKSHGDTIYDRKIVDKIRISLTEKCDPMVVVIEETKDLSTMFVQGLMGSLRSYKQRLLQHSEKSIESAFQSKLNIQPNNGENKLPIQNIEGQNDEGNLFFACQKAFQEDKNVWYLDSGCSNHMTRKKEAFINIDSSFGSKVKLENGEHVEVKGKGSIGVTTKQGSKVIHDTLYVPELDENLLSIGQLWEHGYSLNFENHEGVERQLTIGYTPQQNGVSERKNQVVMEMAKSMLLEKDVQQRSYRMRLHLKLRVEEHLQLTTLKFLGVFSMLKFLKQKRTKLEETSERCVFIGYSSISKGYKIYNLKTNKVIISRDVVFNEKASWNWEEDKMKEKAVPAILLQQNPTTENKQPTPCTPSSSSSPSSPISSSSSPSSTPIKLKDLSDIYARCNYCVMEPENFDEAIK
ncbi:uncharacterized protein LOC127095607 [Lathyrus oleraceus]|uniref:uncharacterized protein LOC127095607 n=1 Tax=Pisum sativum TaxID=3888 RepID=UPI0021CEB5AE|nr:uncharacterized protein LOC127095607 [Pisum sativum]